MIQQNVLDCLLPQPYLEKEPLTLLMHVHLGKTPLDSCPTFCPNLPRHVPNVLLISDENISVKKHDS